MPQSDARSVLPAVINQSRTDQQAGRMASSDVSTVPGEALGCTLVRGHGCSLKAGGFLKWLFPGTSEKT